MLKENNKTQEELEKEIARLEQSIQLIQDSSMEESAIDVLKVAKSRIEQELSSFLRIREVISDEEDGELIEYYLLKDNVEICLNDYAENGIGELPYILNNDLVCICSSSSDLLGIFSFSAKRIIFPFIIADFGVPRQDEFISLILDENWKDQWYDDLDLNEYNNFVYLFEDGSVFQNEGHPIEKLNERYFILERDLNKNEKILYGPSERDDDVALTGIEKYKFIEDWDLLYFENKNGSGIFDLKGQKLIFENQNNFKIDFDFCSRNLFAFYFKNFHQIINRQGKTVFQFATHSDFSMLVQDSKRIDGFKKIEKDTIEFFIGDSFYNSFIEDLNINDDFISMRAFDYQSNRNVVICILEEDIKIIDVDLYHLELQFEKLQDKRFSQDEYVMSIDDYRKKGVRFELFSFFDNPDFEKYFDDKCFSSIQKELDNLSEFEKLSRNDILNERLVGLVNSITRHQQFVDGKLFQVGKGGVINHLMIGF